MGSLSHTDVLVTPVLAGRRTKTGARVKEIDMIHTWSSFPVSLLFEDLKEKKILKLKLIKYIVEKAAENTYIFKIKVDYNEISVR